MRRSLKLRGARLQPRLNPRSTGRRCSFETLEERSLLAVDFGDAPDLAVGTFRGNYQTVSSDNGPSHIIVAGLHLGAHIDGDDGTLQNATANSDNTYGALPIDEDGLSNQDADLMLTVGAQPSVSVRVTNITGAAAVLYGWIDYNADGIFDNATERASIAVPSGADNTVTTLAFPTVTSGFAGTTCARFRLSTDASAANSFGAAMDGEVEDYVATILERSDGTVNTAQTRTIYGPEQVSQWNPDWFGSSIASIGDFDHDGTTDIVVGSEIDDTGGDNCGAVTVLFMNADGTVRSRQKIANGIGGSPPLDVNAEFGSAVASLGDLDGDGISDLAVGAQSEKAAGTWRGAVYILFMNADGTAKSSQKIAHQLNGGPVLGAYSNFGSSISSLGDLDGDGIADLVVGASGDSTAGSFRGAVYVLFLNADGTAKRTQKIAGGGAGAFAVVDNARFGCSVTAMGDLDNDGITEIVVGAWNDWSGYARGGAAYVLFLKSDGSVKSSQKISTIDGGGPPLDQYDEFGRSVARAGDLDGDGITDLFVGEYGDKAEDSTYGSLHVLFLKNDGTVKADQKIAHRAGAPNKAYLFGWSVAPLGDFDGDGVPDIAVGARGEERDPTHRGTVYILSLQRPNLFAPQITTDATASIPENTTSILTIVATDADSPAQAISSSIVGGPDAGAFNLTSTGELAFKWPRDFEVPTDANHDNVYVVTIEASDGRGKAATQTINVSVADVADLPSFDLGDAPDPSAGTGRDNYNTLTVDNGPVHRIVTGLRIGATVDSNDGTLQNATASADDVNGALPDDEDGLSNPLADLTVTAGAQPTVNVWVTNTNGTAATLFGWIDYNADGIFDNSTERASVTVPSGTNSANVTLAFPIVPAGFTGVTYARFRLSSDVAAAFPTGAAIDGEVEDYRVTILTPASGRADPAKNKRITGNMNGGPTLQNGDRFGRSVAAIGDLDGDGVGDLAVGADQYDAEYSAGGAVYILFMNEDGSVKSSTKIASEVGGGPYIRRTDSFGISLASIGDLDGDGLPDIAVGNSEDDLNGRDCGATYVLFLNADGTAKSSQRIANEVGGGPVLYQDDQFGHSITSLGDLDGDGVNELAVGSPGDDTIRYESGATYVLFMNMDGTVKKYHKISNGTIGGLQFAEGELFGTAVAGLGDFDGDGVNDMLVGARGDDGSDSYRGGAYLILLRGDGAVKAWQRIASDEGGGPPLGDYDEFGAAVASLGDLDGDGTTDVAIGARQDNTGGRDRGAVYILYLNADGTVKTRWKIGHETNGGPLLFDYDEFGCSITSLGDLDGDGIADLAVGDVDTGYYDVPSDRFGSVRILFLKPPSPDFGDAPDSTLGNARGNYSTNASDNGPSHIIVAGLKLGGTVEGDDGTLQNASANAESPDGVLPSDEDGLVNAAADLQLTVGAAPTISVWVTNTTGVSAVLYGWIDYNADGVFDNSTERTSIAVPDGADATIFTLTFPRVPTGYTGATYARFRLSTDVAAENPTGPAADGEVEDYLVQVYAPTSGTFDGARTVKITTVGDGPMSSIGDFDNDGVSDLLVDGDKIVFLYRDGTVKGIKKIDDLYFRSANAVAPLGDLDGDGITDFAVGSSYFAPVSIVFLNADGSLKRTQRIPSLVSDGSSVTGVGDLNGDGVSDLAIGAFDEDTDTGLVLLVLLNPDGSAKDVAVIGDGIGGGPDFGSSDYFGYSIASLGDVDGDGFTDIAVGAFGDGPVGQWGYSTRRGAVYILFLNADGECKSYQKIADRVGGGPALADYVSFGVSLAAAGDLDGDGVTDLIVGTYGDAGEHSRGSAYIVNLNRDGTAKRVQKIAANSGGGPPLHDGDLFGERVTALGDLDGDGLMDFAVTAPGDDTLYNSAGTTYVLFSKPAEMLPGDFNQDGVVDAGDYVVWRMQDGSQTNYDLWRANFGRSLPAPPLSGDYTNDGTVDASDYVNWRKRGGTNVGYETWRSNFGTTLADSSQRGGANLLEGGAEFKSWTEVTAPTANMDAVATPEIAGLAATGILEPVDLPAGGGRSKVAENSPTATALSDLTITGQSLSLNHIKPAIPRSTGNRSFPQIGPHRNNEMRQSQGTAFADAIWADRPLDLTMDSDDVGMRHRLDFDDDSLRASREDWCIRLHEDLRNIVDSDVLSRTIDQAIAMI